MSNHPFDIVVDNINNVDVADVVTNIGPRD